jgi:ATP-binding cassette, subfamily C, bacteriocin exporter
MKYPFIKQTDLKSCGISSLLMIIRYYKGNITLEELEEKTKTSKLGTTAYNIIETANELGFNSYGVKYDFNNINGEELILPCIAHVIIEEKYLHYVVIYKVDYQNKKFLIADPATKIKWWTFEEFMKVSSGVYLILEQSKKIPYQKNNSIMSIILEYIYSNKKIISYTIILSFISTIFMVISSFFLQSVLEIINTANNMIILISYIFMNVYLIKHLSDYFRNSILIILSKIIDYKLFTKMYTNIIYLPHQYFNNHTTGEIVSKIEDLNVIKKIITKLILSLGVESIFSLITLIVLYIINKNLFLISLLSILLYVLLSYIFGVIMKSKILKAYELKTKYNTNIVEDISSYESIKTLNLEEEFINSYKRSKVKYLDSINELDNTINYQNLIKDIVSSCVVVLIMAVGYFEVISNNLTIGQMLTFYILYQNFINPLKDLSDINLLLLESNNIVNKMSVFNYTKVETGSLALKRINNIDLTLNYKDILKDIKLKLTNGDKILLYGKSGSGKTTLLKMISGLIETENNTIFINDYDINSYKKNGINKNITYVPQQSSFITDTIMNNIIYKREVSESNLKRVLEITDIRKVIKDKPLLYNYLLEENGSNISGGERQRVILARSLLKKSDVYLFDESFNEIDVESERVILESIFSYYKNNIIIVVSHRLNNQDLYNRTYEIKDGYLNAVS